MAENVIETKNGIKINVDVNAQSNKICVGKRLYLEL